MLISTPLCLSHQASILEAQLVALPASTGIYRIQVGQQQPYLSWSTNLRRRLSRLLKLGHAAEHSLLGRLRQADAVINYWPTGSRLETSLLLYQLSMESHADDYRKRLKLKSTWFVSLTLRDHFPRLMVGNKITELPDRCYGPFRTRGDAELFEQQTSGLFQLRRCPDPLVPAHDHPGCIYGEMNLCLRPCQLVVSEQEYRSEAERAFSFIDTKGSAMMTRLLMARDRASEQTDFEQAAQLHKQVERVKSVAQSRDALVTAISEFNGVALVHGPQEDEVMLWPMLAGLWQQPIVLGKAALEGKSMDAMLKEELSKLADTPRTSGDRNDELALLLRWHSSTWCDGDWFSFTKLADLSYRKLVRRISAMLQKNELPAQRELTQPSNNASS